MTVIEKVYCRICGVDLDDVLKAYCSTTCLHRDVKFIHDMHKLRERRENRGKINQDKVRRKLPGFKRDVINLKDTGMSLREAVFSGRFYDLKEWLELSFKVRSKYPHQCMCCFKTHGPMHVDHIKPKSKFPDLALTEENLQILCRDCNLGKSNRFNTDFRLK